MKGRLIAIPAILLAAAVAFWPGPARAATPLVGWTSQADANPFDLVIDNTGGLGGYHPVAELDLPEDTSVFETGPFGDALASVFWPGSALGNAGSLAGEAGLPSQLGPLLSKLNDPVRAQSFYPEGPSSATYPSSSPGVVAEMKSHSDSSGSWAKAALSDVSVPGVFAIQGVQGSTTATASSVATSTASDSFSSISFLGGLVQIGASASTATANSDGVNPSGASTTHIGAVTIAGHAVTFGSDGLVVGPVQGSQLAQVLAAPTALVNQLISIMNLKITPLPEVETSQAPAENITSGGLQVSFTLPQSVSLSLNCTALPKALAELGVVCHVPDLLQGLTFTATIARATASAIASPPFANPGPGLGSTPGAPSGVSPAGTSAASGQPSGGGAAQNPASTPQLATTPGATTPTGSGGVPLALVGLSAPIKAGLIGWLLVVALIAAVGLRRLGLFLEDSPPSACSLEDGE